MSEKPYFEETHEARLRNWVLYQMLRGAGWAAVLMIAIGAFFLVLRLIAGLLPENPYAALDVIEAGKTLLPLI
ncbi:MAG: RC-LH1 core complex protein PufX [Pseudorhodobacter sp.]|jgi:hypothetical protein|nr:RC-LH1 core complex protein PufX [Pseudorhodobacter sp.]